MCPQSRWHGHPVAMCAFEFAQCFATCAFVPALTTLGIRHSGAQSQMLLVELHEFIAGGRYVWV